MLGHSKQNVSSALRKTDETDWLLRLLTPDSRGIILSGSHADRGNKMGLSEKLKSIGELVVKIHDGELKSDLQQRILDLQGDCFTLQEKNAALLEENGKFKSNLQNIEHREQILADVTLARNVYWKDDNPYCVACAQRDGQLIPLGRRGTHSNTAICPACKADYLNVFGDDPPPEAPSFA